MSKKIDYEIQNGILIYILQREIDWENNKTDVYFSHQVYPNEIQQDLNIDINKINNALISLKENGLITYAKSSSQIVNCAITDKGKIYINENILQKEYNDKKRNTQKSQSDIIKNNLQIIIIPLAFFISVYSTYKSNETDTQLKVYKLELSKTQKELKEIKQAFQSFQNIYQNDTILQIENS
jgi:hypothetical protein